ncbi:MAG TPA: cupin domain-containing protein [Burkholderiales bacterium]|nr:cupin domain-containing protein [Burkholderiales bacterium]
MAVTFNEDDVEREPLADGAARRRLLTEARVAGTKILLDRVDLAPGASLAIGVASTDLAWLQILDGGASLNADDRTIALGASHIVFLPPGARASLTATAETALLYAQVPHAGRFDRDFDPAALSLRVVDWKREPVLDSQYDARKRVYVVTPKLFGTRAVKGEIILYPPDTEGANHHHEGAEHFMYVLRGSGTAYANESPIPVRKGDLIYYGDRERHYLHSEGAEEMAFVEFFVPGEYKTVWAEGAPVCTWNPTGRDLEGRTPARQIRGHSSAAAVPADV